MILPANDPNASRSGWRTSAGEGKAAANVPRRGRAWPFLSPQGRRPAPQDGTKVPRNDSGS